MLNFKKILTILGIASMTALAACGTTTSADGDATDGTGSDATVGADTTGDTATGDATTGDTTTGDTVATATFKSIVIWDKSQEKVDKCGTGPGTDLDAVGLYRAGKLIAVGATGTAAYTAPVTPLKDKAGTSCVAGDGKNSAASAEGPLDAHVYASKSDTGYISLNNGSLEIQFAACKTGTKITDCDGAGALVEIQSGDEIDVWEVDAAYKSGSSTPADGNAYGNFTDAPGTANSCACYADEYQLDLRPTMGSEAGSVYVPASATDYNKGSKTIKVP